jgi:hypothetical protein
MTRIWAGLAAGLVGTVVMTAVLRAASELGFTRMDLPFLLGTAVTDDRRRAKAWGYVLHFGAGLTFALGYVAFFAAIGRGGWLLGLLLGAIHAVVVSTALVNVLLPIVHPRMGTPETAANETALLEAPGFLMENYGRRTFVVTLFAHLMYGAIIGWGYGG